MLAAAGTFAYYCAPTRADDRLRDNAARFLAVFLHVDDAAPEQVRAWIRSGDPWRGHDALPGLSEWFDQAAELRTCAPHLVERLRASFADYLRARCEELDVRASTSSVDDAWHLRARTFFSLPYIDHWLAALDLDVDRLDRPEVEQFTGLATELAFLLNDLVSIEKDAADGGTSRDLNVVSVYQRSNGAPLPEVVAHFVAVHNRKVDEYRALAAMLRREASQGLADYVDLVTSAVVEGNRVAHEVLLPLRYPMSRTGVMTRLRSVL